MSSGTRTVLGIEYRALDRDHDVDQLFEFNKTYGSTPLNFIPDEPVKEHLAKVATGETVVWGAFQDGEMVGMITGERGGGYWEETGAGKENCFFIHEFVVKPDCRGKRIGTSPAAGHRDRGNLLN